jgi:hypothetical protein
MSGYLKDTRKRNWKKKVKKILKLLLISEKTLLNKVDMKSTKFLLVKFGTPLLQEMLKTRTNKEKKNKIEMSIQRINSPRKWRRSKRKMLPNLKE